MSTRIASLAILAGLAGAPAVALAESSAPIAAEVQKIAAPTPASQSDSSGYAQREAQDKSAQSFEGGNTVIVMSGAAFVLLILLLLVI
jgi:hypothetical protein